MSDDRKLPARYSTPLPSVLDDVVPSNQLPSRPDFEYGTKAGRLTRRQRIVDASTDLLLSQRAQSDAYVRLLDGRMAIAKKYAEVLDLPNVIAEQQRTREHSRDLAETRRVIEKAGAVHDLHLALARHETALAQERLRGVRAERNLEAARRVSDVEVDRWYAEAEARRHNAYAERQDAAADLARGAGHQVDPALAADAAARQRADDLATIEHQIELERERGNASAVMALSNLRARLKAA